MGRWTGSPVLRTLFHCQCGDDTPRLFDRAPEYPKVEDKRRVATTGRWVPYLAGKTWDVSILDPVGRTLG
jgi:hypothetical protein